MRALATVLCLVAAACAGPQSSQPFVVKDIRVEGLQRTEPGTVFSYLPVKVGETMTEEKAQQALRALSPPAFSRAGRPEVENAGRGGLAEGRPAIAQVTFVGVKEFDNETLRKILREVGLSEGRTFD